MPKTRRTQILFDEDQYGRLSQASRATGAPISELVRRAVDQALPAQPKNGVGSLQHYIEWAKTSEIGFGDWSEVKKAIADMHVGMANKP